MAYQDNGGKVLRLNYLCWFRTKDSSFSVKMRSSELELEGMENSCKINLKSENGGVKTLVSAWGIFSSNLNFNVERSPIKNKETNLISKIFKSSYK